MTTTHIATLCFSGHGEAAKKRLQKLKRAGLIGERRLHFTDPAILYLWLKGLKVLQTE